MDSGLEIRDLGVDPTTAEVAKKDVSDSVGAMLPALLDGVVGGIKGLSSLVFFLALTALSLFFLLKDGPAIRAWSERHSGVPESVAHVISQRTLGALRGYFVGVTIVAGFNAVVVGCGALLLGVPLAATIAVVTFLGAYIPYLGAWGAGAFSVFVTLGGAGAYAAVAMAVIQLLANGLLQQLVQPIAYGAALGIHPLAVLVVTIAGGALFGAPGLILAAPVTSALVRISGDLAAPAQLKARTAQRRRVRTERASSPRRLPGRPADRRAGGDDSRRVRRSSYHRHPLPPPLIAGLALGVVLLGVLFFLSALEYAYRRIGVPEGALFALMVSSLLGGAVNIPVARWETRPTVVEAEIVVFGIRYRLPVVRRPRSTIVAVNLGGAVIPLGLSLYLLVAGGIWWPALAATAIVTVVVQRVARAVPGLGIAVPALLPPALSASAAVLLASSRTAAVAYVSGTLGTLIGGDLLNLRKVREMAPAVAAIGGAGSFDGIFLSGLGAVLLVGLL